MCRYCCKSPKLPGANFSAVKKSDPRPPIDVASITLPRSPVSLSSGDEVPHIFTRKSRLRPKEFLISSAKRLLQQNRQQADSRGAARPHTFRGAGSGRDHKSTRRSRRGCARMRHGPMCQADIEQSGQSPAVWGANARLPPWSTPITEIHFCEIPQDLTHGIFAIFQRRWTVRHETSQLPMRSLCT
jgi:hypothetical protein